MTRPEDKPLHIKIVEALNGGNAKLFHDQYQDTYLSPDGSGRSVLALRSRSFTDWLGRYCYVEFGQVLSSDVSTKVTNTLSGLALFGGSMIELQIRATKLDSSLWYDLGDSAVLVTPNHWEVLDRPKIIFKRLPHQNNQITPAESENIGRVLEYVNLKDEDDQLLFLVYLVAAFIPGFPHPLLIVHGAQGAGKTTPMRILKTLIDPSKLQGLPPPSKPDDFVHVAAKHYFLFYDNLSAMPAWLSDTLARACTGDSFSKRALYTDDDDVIYSFQRTIAINGINQVVTRSDLLDRSVLLNLERIPEDKRIEESVFWESFNKDKPEILGAIFAVLSRAIESYPDVQVDKLPRMADFYRWGCAISIALGRPKEDFMRAYQANISNQHDEAIESSPVAQAIIELMHGKQSWQGTPTELLDELNSLSETPLHAKNAGLPQHPNWLSRNLTTLQPNLFARGLLVERKDSARPRKIVIKNTVATDVLSELSVVTDIFGEQFDAPDVNSRYDDTDSKLQ